MEDEDAEAIAMQEGGYYSDEDEYPISKEWKEHDFDKAVAESCGDQEWEYKENEVVQGVRYASSDEVKAAVKLWALSLRREFKVVKSTQSVYDVKCLNQDCPWRVHAYKGIWRILEGINCC